MRTFAAGGLQRGPRRSQLTNAGRPYRRGELAAGLSTIVLIAEFLLVPVAVPICLVLLAVSRVSRWRPEWLLLPLLTGVGWLTAAGSGWASTTLAAGPGQLLSALARVAGDPPWLPRDPGGATATAVAWLHRELPAGLAVGALQAGLLAWLNLRRGDEGFRPGLLAATRRWRNRGLLAAGETVTGAGFAMGLDPQTGRLAGLSWAAAERGVLLAGTDPGELAGVALAVACAAMRRRKAVLVVDFDEGGDAAAHIGSVALLAGSLDIPVSRVSRIDGGLRTAAGRAIRARSVMLAAGPSESLADEVTDVLAWLSARGLRADSLLCISGCEAADPARLGALLALGPSTGTAVLASTTSAACAEALAGHAGQTVVCGPVDTELTSRLTAARLPADSGRGRDQYGDALARQRPGEFTVIGPDRVQPGCRAVPIVTATGPAEAGRSGARRTVPRIPAAAGSR